MKFAIFISILDQILVSGFNFCISLFLINRWSSTPEFFGIYSFVLAASFVCISIQNALVLSQLSVLRPRARVRGTEGALLAMLWTINVLIVLFAMVVTFLASLKITGAENIAIVLSSTAFVGVTLVREYTRGYYFSDIRPVAVLAQDSVSILLSGTAICVILIYNISITVELLLWVLAVGQILVSIFVIIASRDNFKLSASSKSRQAYRSIWREQSRWALLGVITTEFQQRGHVFVVAGAFGASEVALLQAAGVIFRPISLVAQAWAKLARAALAGYYAHGENRKARRFTLFSLTAVLCLFAFFLVALALAWPLVKRYIFVGSFSNLETVVIYWSFATAIVLVNGVLGIEAQSLAKFRELSVGSVLGAIATALILGIAILAGDFRLSIVAVFAGQLVLFVVICRIRRDVIHSKDVVNALAPTASSEGLVQENDPSRNKGLAGEELCDRDNSKGRLGGVVRRRADA